MILCTFEERLIQKAKCVAINKPDYRFNQVRLWSFDEELFGLIFVLYCSLLFYLEGRRLRKSIGDPEPLIGMHVKFN